MTNSYQDFASLYDALTFDVSYEKIADFIEWLFKKNNLSPELVLDLACGTGTVTSLLARRGYDMLGADASEDMLAEARKKEGSESILYLHQAMENFELYGTVDAIICVLDSINYLTEPKNLKKTFALCANYLNPGGLLIFDVNSEYKFREILGQETYTYETEDVFYVWENDYNEESRLCDLYLTFFKEEPNGLYRRLEETHTQRAYSEAELTDALEKAGFAVLARYDDYTKNVPNEYSQRVVYEAKKIL
ncbi:MAG: class I SAM-dependent methyltransferase [Clostridia bacterium]|nr:class I SAM-dependent methyltransferase [Clostridia bacterium]